MRPSFFGLSASFCNRASFLVFTFVLFVGPFTQAAYPSAQELPEDVILQNDFLPFQSALPPFSAPLTRGLTVNGVPDSNLQKYFDEKFFVSLPDLEKIEETEPNLGLKKWNFPKGTRIVHEIRYRDQKSSLFELRMVEKLEEATWGFGVYIPRSGKLILQSPEMENSRLDQLTSLDGTRWEMNLRPTPQRVCARCHRGATTDPYPSDNPHEAGPCGFTSENPFVTKDWVNLFQAKKGYSPIERR